MKQPSKPTRAQKEIISNNNLVPDHWMVISESRDTLEIISRRSGRKKVLTKCFLKQLYLYIHFH